MVALGMVIDILMAAFLLLVFGWILDSWKDRVPWTGPIVTTIWTIAFVMSAGAPIRARWLQRRQAPYGRIALVAWMPVMVLVGLTIVGYMVSPAR